jgi:antitoxin FitA
MGVLNVRNLPDTVLSRLRVRAAEHNRSMEAEARAILTAAVSEAPAAPYDVGGLRGLALRLGGTGGGVVDEFLAERRAEARRENRTEAGSRRRAPSRAR